MAILSGFDWGWFVDHQKSIDDAYRNVISTAKSNIFEKQCNERIQYQSQPDLFAIYESFMMDSEYSAQKSKLEKSEELTSRIDRISAEELELLSKKPIEMSRKKRKRKREINTGEALNIEQHCKIKPLLKKALKLLHTSDLLTHDRCSTVNGKDNNRAARNIAQLSCTLPSLSEIILNLNSNVKQKRYFEGKALSFFNNLFTNDEEAAVLIELYEGHKYLIPAGCRFLMSDVSELDQLAMEGSLYDIIVIDPPWRNKSVKRKKTYSTLSEQDLIKLPVRKLAQEGGLVAVWATNKMSQQNFVTQHLLPAWNVQLLAHWYWLKITCSGEPVYSLDTDDISKRPYETLFIGRYKKCQNNSSESTEATESIETTPTAKCTATYVTTGTAASVPNCSSCRNDQIKSSSNYAVVWAAPFCGKNAVSTLCHCDSRSCNNSVNDRIRSPQWDSSVRCSDNNLVVNRIRSSIERGDLQLQTDLQDFKFHPKEMYESCGSNQYSSSSHSVSHKSFNSDVNSQCLRNASNSDVINKTLCSENIECSKSVVNSLCTDGNIDCNTTKQSLSRETKDCKDFDSTDIMLDCARQNKNCKDYESAQAISDNMVIISVPCSVHSRKPPLNEILRQFVGTQTPACLEMFARNLLPGWTSWGNEVLMFQHKAFFKEMSSQ